MGTSVPHVLEVKKAIQHVVTGRIVCHCRMLRKETKTGEFILLATEESFLHSVVSIKSSTFLCLLCNPPSTYFLDTDLTFTCLLCLVHLIYTW